MTLLSRFGQAAKVLFAPEKRIAPPFYTYGTYGLPAQFKPSESLDSYTNNVWLYSAINVIASEISRTDFRLQRTRANGEIEYVKSHQAIETLTHPSAVNG